MLQFCPVCKSLLQLRNEDGKNILFCSCGFKRYNFDLETSDKGKNKFRGEGVAKDNNEWGVDFICKKCGFKKAELIDLGERATNENGVYIFKCLRCGYSERKI